MPVDASIPLGVKPVQFDGPVNALAKVMQIQGLQQEQGMNALKMDEYKRGIDDQNALRSALSAPDADPYKVLLGRGKVKEATEYAKGLADNKKSAADTQKTTLEATQKKMEMKGQALGWLKDNPTLENATFMVQTLTQQGILSPEESASALEHVKADPSPQGIAKLATMGYQSALAAKDQLPKLQTSDIGGQTVTQTVNPITGQTATTGTIQNTQSPNNKATVDAAYANAGATRDVAQSNRDAAHIQTGFQNEQGLRKEFEGLPEVKSYKQAYPAYAAIKDAAKRSTPQSDINIVYGIAKLYDPNSVVREGEYATVANSPNIPERIKGYAQYLAGGGKLSTETKKQILTEADGRIKSYQAEHDKARASYDGIAKRRGIDPANVFQATGDAPMGGGAGNTPKVVDFGSLR